MTDKPQGRRRPQHQSDISEGHDSYSTSSLYDTMSCIDTHRILCACEVQIYSRVPLVYHGLKGWGIYSCFIVSYPLVPGIDSFDCNCIGRIAKRACIVFPCMNTDKLQAPMLRSAFGGREFWNVRVGLNWDVFGRVI